MMIPQIPRKTYSRKRRRALSDPTDSPSTSSPFPAASASSKNVRDTKKTCTTLKHMAKSGASGSIEEVSPERPSKKMKRHSSSTATPSTRLGIPSSVPPGQSALTSESLPPAILTTSDTKSSYPSVLLRNANDPRPPSTSEHIKSSTSPLHQPESGLKQSNAGQPLPFRRTRSQTQKENVLAHPQTLGSPFQIAPTSSLRPHTTSDMRAAKQSRSSRFVRRPSADIFRAHTSSSASFRRRPSGSHALQKKSTQNQDWLVAPPRIPSSADEKIAALDPEININRSHSFFSPQGSSTPLPLRRYIHYGTPMTPTPSIPSGNKESSPRRPMDSIMSDTKSTSEESSVRTPGPASDLYTSSPREPGVISLESDMQPPHRVLHLPHDSIFSSFDVSAASATTVRVLVDPRFARDEVVEERDEQPDSLLRSSPVPEGNKLHDMFSVLALAEQKKPSQDSGIGLNKVGESLNVMEVMKGGKSDCGSPQNMERSPSKAGVANEIPTVHGEKISATRKRKQRRAAGSRPTSSSTHQNVPKHGIQVCTDNEPLTVGDDEEDELLLTSKGWDWDPQ